MSLPAGVVNGLTDFTISTWVNPVARPTWSRIFDFGASTARGMFLTASAGSAPRFAITTSGSGGEQRLNGTAPLALNQWSHVAVTLHRHDRAGMYVNGALVATNANMTLNPASLGATANNYIGRSQYADPYLNATVDDFQIYDRGLGEADVAALAGGTPGAGNVASYRFDEASGATAADSSGNGRDATIVSPAVNVLTPTGLTGYWEAPFMFKRNGTYYMAYARGNPATGGQPGDLRLRDGEQPARAVDLSRPDPRHRDQHDDEPRGDRRVQGPVVRRLPQRRAAGRRRVPPLRLGRQALLQPRRHDPEGRRRRSARRRSRRSRRSPTCTSTAPTSSRPCRRVPLEHVRLHRLRVGAAGVGAGGPADLRLRHQPELHDVPDDQGPTGNPRFAITTNGAGGEQRIDGTAPLPVDRWTHVAVTKSALGAQLYVNGVQVGQHTNLGLYPARLGNAPNNWIGRSQNAADPYLARRDGRLPHLPARAER